MPPLNGVLVVDKPAGPTSHDVVARVRRVLRERRVGHTGTLDPFATGVLPLVVGKATRLSRFLTGREKSYVAVMRLGISTDTHDSTGVVSGGARLRDTGARLPSPADVEAALAAFRGPHRQAPPAFSAKKIGGVRSYETARRHRALAGSARGQDDDPGAPVPTPALVDVITHELSLEAADDDLVTLRLRVSAGFYVRALAHAVGERLGCGAHLVSLRRTASGDFAERDALPLDTLERDAALAVQRLIPMSRLLTDCPAVRLTPAGLARIAHGQAIDDTMCEDDERTRWVGGRWSTVRLIGPDGELAGLATAHAGGTSSGWPLHPAIVLT